MRADSKENLLLEKPATSVLTSGASEDRPVPTENSHGESALLRLAELADQFDAEQVAADARSVAERVSEGRFYVACIGQFRLVIAAYYTGEDKIGKRGLAYRNPDVITYVAAIRTTYLREAGIEPKSTNTVQKRDVR